MAKPVVALALLLLPATVLAARPTLTDEQTLVSPAGHVRVHYAGSGAGAPPAGQPEIVAGVADQTWATMVDEGGFRGWLDDDGGGGGPELDLYLVELAGADGHFEPLSCTSMPFACYGWAEVDNDFVGYGYPSAEVGAQVVVSHELFHAIQAAYDQDQGQSWSEGTAVWAEEVVYPAQEDYEHLVEDFLAKPFRPFDRDGGGFGDGYPYGTALWATFLEEFLGAGTVRAIWEGCQDLDGSDPLALDVIAGMMDLGDLWIEFTRWNAMTASHAVAGQGYAHAADLPEVFAEPQLDVGASVELGLEGLSSRVVPLQSADADLLVTVTAPAGAPRWAAAVILFDGTRVEVTAEGARIPANASSRLVVTSAQKMTLPWRATASLAIAPPLPDPPGDDGGCGCDVGGQRRPLLWPVLLLAVLVWRRRRDR